MPEIARLLEQGRALEALRLYRSAADLGDMTAGENLQRLGKADPRALSQASAQAIPATLEVPLKRVGGVLVLPALVNETVTVNFVLDSGASDVSLPEEVVQALVGAGTLGSFDFTGTDTFTYAAHNAACQRAASMRDAKKDNPIDRSLVSKEEILQD